MQDPLQTAQWKRRVLDLTGRQQTKLGLIAMAVLGEPCALPPMISMKRGAVIDEDGRVWANVWLPGMPGYGANCLCSIRDLVDNFRRIADILKLSDEDRVALFAEVQKWCGRDLRARKKVELANW